MRTFQLRRYELETELAQEFVSWAVNVIFPLRRALGYSVEWSYFDHANSEFVWLASAECNQAEFEARDIAWLASPERASAVVTMPQALVVAHVSFVESV